MVVYSNNEQAYDFSQILENAIVESGSMGYLASMAVVEDRQDDDESEDVEKSDEVAEYAFMALDSSKPSSTSQVDSNTESVISCPHCDSDSDTLNSLQQAALNYKHNEIAFKSKIEVLDKSVRS